MKTQIAMILCVLGWTILLIIPDHTVAADKFFQTGGRFGKRHEERIPDLRYAELKTRSVGNVPPRIERGFYISRYGKRFVNSATESDYITYCLPSYGVYCDYTELSNQLRCKRIHPSECSKLNRANEKPLLKTENDQFVNNY